MSIETKIKHLIDKYEDLLQFYIKEYAPKEDKTIDGIEKWHPGVYQTCDAYRDVIDDLKRLL